MSIQYRSPSKRKAADSGADAILTRDDFEQAVAAVNMTLADISKATNIHRQYLSEFKSGDRNLRAEMRQTLREFFEGQGVEFIDDDFPADGEDAATDPRQVRATPQAAQVFPLPSVVVTMRALPEIEEANVMWMLDAQVRENDGLLSQAVEIKEGLAVFFIDDELSSESKRIHEELRQGLAAEAVLRRVLDGSFTARASDAKPATQADLIASTFLATLAHDSPTSANSPAGPAAASDDEAEAAGAAGKAGGLPGPFAFLDDQKEAA